MNTIALSCQTETRKKKTVKKLPTKKVTYCKAEKGFHIPGSVLHDTVRRDRASSVYSSCIRKQALELEEERIIARSLQGFSDCSVPSTRKHLI